MLRSLGAPFGRLSGSCVASGCLGLGALEASAEAEALKEGRNFLSVLVIISGG